MGKKGRKKGVAKKIGGEMVYDPAKIKEQAEEQRLRMALETEQRKSIKKRASPGKPKFGDAERKSLVLTTPESPYYKTDQDEEDVPVTIEHMDDEEVKMGERPHEKQGESEDESFQSYDTTQGTAMQDTATDHPTATTTSVISSEHETHEPQDIGGQFDIQDSHSQQDQSDTGKLT